jgi:mRNA-decapping enzyme subunit 2
MPHTIARYPSTRPNGQNHGRLTQTQPKAHGTGSLDYRLRTEDTKTTNNSNNYSIARYRATSPLLSSTLRYLIHTSNITGNMTAAATTDPTITFEDALDDVHTRFLLNLPAEELASADRIFFQIEQAWWFYEDIVCDGMVDPDDGTSTCQLPRYTTLKPFALQLFQFSPLLEDATFTNMWQQFSNYKRKISNYGMILLTAGGDKMILCQTWTGNTWTLPAGKINQGETGRDSAARECYEETGFDPYAGVGLAASDDYTGNTPWTIAEQALSYQEPNGGKRRTYYICIGVPEDFPFEPVARKEVSQVSWFDLDSNSLPKRSFGVLPVMGKLRKWIKTHCKTKNKSRAKSRGKNQSTGRPKSTGRDKSAGQDNPNKRHGSASSRSKQQRTTIQTTQDPLVDAGLADIGDVNRWSEDDMFKANEALLGRRVEYDGNPHVFSEQGFGGNDPHAFRVVGGGFMNSGDGLSNIINAQQAAKQYQPLVKEGDEDGDALPLTPFFTQGGETPWGEVVAEAALENASSATTNSSAPNPGDALLQMLQGGGTSGGGGGSQTAKSSSNNKSKSKKKQFKSSSKTTNNPATSYDDDDGLDVLTDAQITRSSQARHQQKQKRMQDQYEKDSAFIQQWVANLPNPIKFRIPNVDEIIQQHFG